MKIRLLISQANAWAVWFHRLLVDLDVRATVQFMSLLGIIKWSCSLSYSNKLKYLFSVSILVHISNVLVIWDESRFMFGTYITSLLWIHLILLPNMLVSFFKTHQTVLISLILSTHYKKYHYSFTKYVIHWLSTTSSIIMTEEMHSPYS